MIINSPVSQELLDVVDENDRVVDTRKRGEIHALGLMHRAVHILVFNNEGDLFLQKRSMTKDECPGLWDTSAAGHVNSGEEYLACAQRELHEELGIYIDEPLKFLFNLAATENTGMEHCRVYKCINDGPMVLQEEEIDEGRWVSVDEMDQRVAVDDADLTHSLRLIWFRYRQYQGD